MELREYFEIIGRHKRIFWGVVIIAIVATFIFTKIQPRSYLASTTLTINKSSALKQSETNYYLFDNYYNVQSSGLFSKIVVSWLESPAVVKDIYQKADLTLPNVSQNKLGKTFKAAWAEPATISVSISNPSKEDADKLINAAADVVQEKANELGKSDQENIYDIVKFTPIVTETTPNLYLNLFIGLVAGIILSVIFVLAIDYFQEDNKKK